MKIKSLQIKNIRSYVDEQIDFPDGNILFEGDVGSGKSTILIAVEFALFGLTPDIPGANLLRSGQKYGEVTLTFEVDGKEYKISRALSMKAGNVAQTEGYLVFDAQKYNYSPQELRTKILQILKFNEESSHRSSSKIFRYAVFIPQEEIKTILDLKPTDRLQTLRKAFGLEEYKTAQENSQLLMKEIKSIIDVKTGFFSDLPSLEKNLEKSAKDLSDLQSIFSEISRLTLAKQRDFEIIDLRLKEMQEQREKAASMQSKISHLNNDIAYKNSQIKSFESRIQQSEARLSDLKTQLAALPSIAKSVGNTEEVKFQAQQLKETAQAEQRLLGKIENTLENYKSLLSKKVCPTCEQEVNASEFSGKISEFEKQAKEKMLRIGELEKEKLSMDAIIENLQKTAYLEKQHQMLASQVAEREKILLQDKSEYENAKIELSLLAKEYNDAVIDFEKLKSGLENFDALNSERLAINNALQKLISEKAALSQKVNDLDELNKNLAGQISEKQKAKARKEELDEIIIWLRDYFIPTLDSIEKHVMHSLNSEFNNQFRRWFNMLMEGSEISVGVDETFTPQVEQNGYLLDINSLSGGEKTSVALSYRLALNNLVKQICSSLKSNLLIMDEPTDGFSKEQLFKIKDVLESLNCEQTIIVSHERELESFVDTIFKIEKQGHISKIRKLN